MTTISRWVFKAPHVLKATLFSAQREMNYIIFFSFGVVGWGCGDGLFKRADSYVWSNCILELVLGQHKVH